MNVGQRIKELRIKKRLTQEALAERAKISLSYVQTLERGGQNITLETLGWLARILGCHPRTFFDRARSKDPGPGRPRRRKSRK